MSTKKIINIYVDKVFSICYTTFTKWLREGITNNMAYIFINCRKELNMSKIDYRLEIQEENKQIELIKEITFLLDDLSIDKLKEIKDSITCID